MVNLEKLELGENKIIKLEGLDNLTKLEEFYCGNNKLKKIERLG